MATPFPFSTGQVLTAAQMNSIGEWTSFAPTWKFGTNTITTNAGYGFYAIVNEIVIIRMFMRYQSAAGGGTFNVTVPADAAIYLASNYHRCGYGSWDDSSAAQSYIMQPYAGGVTGNSTTVFHFLGGYPGWTITDVAPFTVGGNDECWVTIIGEKA